MRPDFKTCPLLYRFRSIDRLREQPTRDATRGTVVHAVLEHLYDFEAADRTVEAAQATVEAEWQRLVEENPDLVRPGFAEDADGQELAHWLESARGLVANYFSLEDPQRLEPAARLRNLWRWCSTVCGCAATGHVDRLDITASGDLRVVDYKTGATPREAFEAKALFQMKFYALVLWRTRGVVPKRQLRLMYLADVRHRSAISQTQTAIETHDRKDERRARFGERIRLWTGPYRHWPGPGGGRAPPFPPMRWRLDGNEAVRNRRSPCQRRR